jgi:hypothetical protein
MQIPERFTPEVLKKPPNFGVLELLEGTWVNHNPDNNKTGWGLHTTCMPSPGTNSETIPGKFTFVCENYKETLTFTLVKDAVRNRAGTNEQFCGAVKYDQSIQDLEGRGLHEENGMYLWLDQIYNHPADDTSIETDLGAPELSSGAGANGPTFVPSYSISRSGTIPHGSTVQIFGKDSKHDGKPEFPVGTDAWNFDHLALSRSMGGAGTTANMPIDLDKEPPDWVKDKTLQVTEPSGNKTYTQRILAHELYPYSVRPDLRLRDAVKNQQVKEYILIQMDTQEEEGPQGGILNIPLIRKYVPVTRMRLRLWIETIIEDGQEVQQLQYEQITNFEFHFGTDGGTTLWPHIQVNTLRKLS